MMKTKTQIVLLNFAMWTGLAVLLLYFLTGCSLTSVGIGTETELGPLEEYSEKFKDQLAWEVDHICGNDDIRIMPEYPTACIFIKDHLILREKIHAIQD